MAGLSTPWGTRSRLLGATPGPIKTVIIAAFGTLIGAWLTSCSQEKRRVVEELRAIHAAFTICFAIVNKGLGIKRQHIRPMKADFDAAVARYDAWMEADPKPPLEFDLDLRTLSKVRFDGPTLERVVFEKCSLGHLGLAAVLSLEDATNDLNTSIEYRNNLISQFQQNPPATELERIILYVGAYGDGKVDERFAHNLEALLHQADDIIFFGMVLSQELLKLERRIRARNRWKYRLGDTKAISCRLDDSPKRKSYSRKGTVRRLALGLCEGAFEMAPICPLVQTNARRHAGVSCEPRRAVTCRRSRTKASYIAGRRLSRRHGV